MDMFTHPKSSSYQAWNVLTWSLAMAAQLSSNQLTGLDITLNSTVGGVYTHAQHVVIILEAQQ